jgi:hypothetical protein
VVQLFNIKHQSLPCVEAAEWALGTHHAPHSDNGGNGSAGFLFTRVAHLPTKEEISIKEEKTCVLLLTVL